MGGDYESPEAAIQAALEQGWTGLHELDSMRNSSIR